MDLRGMYESVSALKSELVRMMSSTSQNTIYRNSNELIHGWENGLFGLFAGVVATASSDTRVEMHPQCTCESISAFKSQLVVPTMSTNRPNKHLSNFKRTQKWLLRQSC